MWNKLFGSSKKYASVHIMPDNPSQDESESELLTKPRTFSALNQEERVGLTSEKQSTESHNPHGGHESDIPGSVFNIVNAIVGAGLIGIPFAFNKCGLYLGIMLLGLVSYMIDYSLRTMILFGAKVKKTNYMELCEHCFGRTGFYVVSLFILLTTFGGMCAYTVIVGDTLPKVFIHLNVDLLDHRDPVVIFASTLVMLPLSLLKNLSSLSFSSSLSILASVILIIIVILFAPEAAKEDGIDVHEEYHPYAFAKSTFFSGIGTMSFAFVIQHTSFFIYQGLKNPTQQRWTQTTHISLAIAFFLCTVFGVAGYTSFLSHTEGDLLNNFEHDHAYVNVARILLALSMMMVYPVEMFVARQAMFSLVFRGQSAKMTDTQHVRITVGLWIMTLIVGISFHDLGDVLELTGSVAASTLGYILPGLIFIKMNESNFKQWIDMWRPSNSAYSQTSIKKKLIEGLQFAVPIFYIIFGLLLMAAGSSSVIMSKLGGEEHGPHLGGEEQSTLAENEAFTHGPPAATP